MDVLIFQRLLIALGLLIGRIYSNVFSSFLLNDMQTLLLKLSKVHSPF